MWCFCSSPSVHIPPHDHGVHGCLYEQKENTVQLARHFLISGSYLGDKAAVPSRDLSKAVTSFLDDCDVEPALVMAYTTPYFIRPERMSLKDIWLAMTDLERDDIRFNNPALHEAISTMVGGVENALVPTSKELDGPR